MTAVTATMAAANNTVAREFMRFCCTFATIRADFVSVVVAQLLVQVLVDISVLDARGGIYDARVNQRWKIQFLVEINAILQLVWHFFHKIAEVGNNHVFPLSVAKHGNMKRLDSP